MRRTLELALCLFTTLLIMSCNSGEASNQTIEVNATANHESGYTCVMHPEVTGKEGGQCPKCGMALVQRKANAITNAYYMQLASLPAPIIPNKEVVLSLTPKKKDAPSDQVKLAIEHEKKIHLILVSDDLSWFEHIHPEQATDGSYVVKAKFPAPGSYKAFADYKPVGGTQIVDKIELQVEGSTPHVKSFTSEKLSGSSGNYSFALTPIGGQLLTGDGSQMEGVIKKDGRVIDVNTLVDYLGAKAHIVVVSLNEKEYLHVHPEVVNGKFNIHTTFSKPGIYRGWIQFNGDDKLHTIDFTLDVRQGSVTDNQKDNTDHNSGSSGKDHSVHHH
jgi:hypothetical protein